MNKVFTKNCSDCWAQKFCSSCFAHMDSINYLSEFCEHRRNEVEMGLKNYLSLSKDNPAYINYLNNLEIY